MRLRTDTWQELECLRAGGFLAAAYLTLVEQRERQTAAIEEPQA